MRNYNTIEYLGIWEQLNNPNFNPLEFEGYLQEAASNAFTLSPQKWKKQPTLLGYLLKDLTKDQLSFKYASEADMLNVALFNIIRSSIRENILLS